LPTERTRVDSGDRDGADWVPVLKHRHGQIRAPAACPGPSPHARPPLIRFDVLDYLDLTVEHRRADMRRRAVCDHGKDLPKHLSGAGRAAADRRELEQVAVEADDERAPTTKQAPCVVRDR